MNPKAPVLDLFIGRDHDAWRMYVAETSWMPGLLRMRADKRREIFPVAKPDADDLERFMFETDSPYAEARVMRRERSLLLLGSTIIGD
jgi:hypothetical protein